MSDDVERSVYSEKQLKNILQPIRHVLKIVPYYTETEDILMEAIKETLDKAKIINS